MYTVLHVEQSEFFLKMARNIIEEKQYKYIATNDINEAITILENNKIDLVITSFYPTGGSVEELIKEVNSKYEAPIFVVTSNNIDANKKDLINLGVTEYILKNDFEEEIGKHINYVFRYDKYMNDLREAKIAVVEDSNLEKEFQKEIFYRYNIKNIDFYESGDELEKSRKEYDIYLVDIVLKNEFGKELIRKLRVNNIEAIIIAVTGLDNTKTLASILDAGANDIINKPIDESLFISKLKSNIRVYTLNKEIKRILDK